jgi:putative glutamine amidotransferase
MAGGVPVLLPVACGAVAAAVTGRIDALLLTGGGDVDPARYGATASPATGGVNPERDDAELGLLAAALARGLPVLGVCRGCQVVNVAFGGTLHQHLPEITAAGHRQPNPRDRPVHPVAVRAGSLLAEVVGTDELWVNSIHHQAVDRLAPSLQAVASSPDGIVEAVEDRDRSLLAVQWHPENLVTAPRHLALFRWLVTRGQREG